MKRNLFPFVFLISFFFVITGAYLKILHFESAETFLIIGVILSLISLITGIYEVARSTKIHSSEKRLWILGFVFLNFLTSIFYLGKRSRIVK